MKRIIFAVLSAFVFIAFVNGQSISTLTLNQNVEHQTIDGFGGMWGKNTEWESPFWDSAFAKLMINDLGITIHRPVVPSGFEYINDNNDPNVLNLNGFNLTTTQSGCQFENMNYQNRVPWYRALKAEAEKQGEPLKFFATVFSPPHWMKYNECIRGDDTTNKLMPEFYNEFAEYCVGYIKIFQRDVGVEPYALSIQNEPAFPQSGFQSAVYTASEYRDALKIVGARFEKEGIKTKLLGPEDMLDAVLVSGVRSFFVTIKNDPEARKYLKIYAVHGYTDGIKPSATSIGAILWKKAKMVADTFKVPLWQSETSGFPSDWNGAMNVAVSIYSGLKYGDITAWMYQALGTNGDYGLCNNGVPTLKYYALKHFCKYVRPGAIRIDASSSDSSIHSVAFNNRQKKILSIVILNTTTTVKEIKLSGDYLPSELKQYVSTASQKCVDKGTIAADASLSLPANSITTIVGQNYNPVSANVKFANIRNNTIVKTNFDNFSIDGKRIVNNQKQSGIILKVLKNGKGKIVSPSINIRN